MKWGLIGAGVLLVIWGIRKVFFGDERYGEWGYDEKGRKR